MSSTATGTNGQPLPHDGWASRKVIMGGALLGLVVVSVVATIATGKVDEFLKLVPYLQTVVPSIVVPTMAALTADKFAESKRK